MEGIFLLHELRKMQFVAGLLLGAGFPQAFVDVLEQDHFRVMHENATQEEEPMTGQPS